MFYIKTLKDYFIVPQSLCLYSCAVRWKLKIYGDLSWFYRCCNNLVHTDYLWVLCVCIMTWCPDREQLEPDHKHVLTTGTTLSLNMEYTLTTGIQLEWGSEGNIFQQLARLQTGQKGWQWAKTKIIQFLIVTKSCHKIMLLDMSMVPYSNSLISEQIPTSESNSSLSNESRWEAVNSMPCIHNMIMYHFA